MKLHTRRISKRDYKYFSLHFICFEFDMLFSRFYDYLFVGFSVYNSFFVAVGGGKQNKNKHFYFGNPFKTTKKSVLK